MMASTCHTSKDSLETMGCAHRVFRIVFRMVDWELAMFSPFSDWSDQYRFMESIVSMDLFSGCSILRSMGGGGSKSHAEESLSGRERVLFLSHILGLTRKCHEVMVRQDSLF